LKTVFDEQVPFNRTNWAQASCSHGYQTALKVETPLMPEDNPSPNDGIAINNPCAMHQPPSLAYQS